MLAAPSSPSSEILSDPQLSLVILSSAPPFEGFCKNLKQVLAVGLVTHSPDTAGQFMHRVGYYTLYTALTRYTHHTFTSAFTHAFIYGNILTLVSLMHVCS